MVTQYNNILPEELYIEVLSYVKMLMEEKSMNFTTSTLTWNNKLKGHSVPILRYDFSKNDVVMYNKIKKELEKQIPYFVDSFCLHVWSPLSYITWHDDSHTKAALTLYLNETWDENWGGYLMYKENSEIKAIKPERNLGVLQENGVEHSVTTINVGANVRLSLQFFLTKTKKVV